jgi:hypothetical protein
MSGGIPMLLAVHSKAISDFHAGMRVRSHRISK